MRTDRAVIVQCRLSSTRLPGKALLDLGGKTVLAWVLCAMKKVRADRYFVATDEESFAQIKSVCDRLGFECFAGSLDDVLGRFCALLRTIDVRTVIRATADNPFLFFEAAEDSAREFERLRSDGERCDYLTYTGLPHGSGVEVFSAPALLSAEANTDSPYDHEHVGPALYKHTDKFVCKFIDAPRRFRHPELRTTIDTYSDYVRALALVRFLGADSAPYTCEQVVSACGAPGVQKPVVLLPSVQKGHGTGHLRRCLELAVQTGYFVFIPDDRSLEETDALVTEFLGNGLDGHQILRALPDQTYAPVVITDTFRLSEPQRTLLASAESVISIDEGSDSPDFCDYLLDIIPPADEKREVNYFSSGFITRPQHVRTPAQKDAIQKILVCLGGEDPAGITVPAAGLLTRLFPDAAVTAIVRQLPPENENPRLHYSLPVQNLRERLSEYDAVVTHYGLTAFEAAYAGCAVVLLPTSRLHVSLAEKYHFANAGTAVTGESLKAAFDSPFLYPEFAATAPDNHDSLPEFLKKLVSGERLYCPICGKSEGRTDAVIARNAGRTYRRCRSCSMVYLSFTTDEKKSYSHQYFFEDYKKQYGKTYQEDFDAIKAQCVRRIGNIKKIAFSLAGKNALDIGCAYGPFLSAASEMGLSPFGTDISEEAVSSVQNELHFPAACAAFPEFDSEKEFGVQQFDVVTMWYVIEHFKELDAVLRKVSALVKKGGVFAFSTPSGEGISARSDRNHFYQISPADHYSVWEPSVAQKILARYGFKVEKIVSTGHHPERFPAIRNSGSEKGSLQWAVVEKISRLNRLGDTVELYCRKR